jgi:hypothetical protein
MVFFFLQTKLSLHSVQSQSHLYAVFFQDDFNTRNRESAVGIVALPAWHCGPTRTMASPFLRFVDHTQRRTTVGRTPPDEWSARRRDLYLTIHNTYNRQTSMPQVGFEPTISADERPQTCSSDRTATGIGTFTFIVYPNYEKCKTRFHNVTKKLFRVVANCLNNSAPNIKFWQ